MGFPFFIEGRGVYAEQCIKMGASPLRADTQMNAPTVSMHAARRPCACGTTCTAA